MKIERWEVEILHVDSDEWMTVELGEEILDGDPPLTEDEVINIIKSGIVYRAKFLGTE